MSKLKPASDGNGVRVGFLFKCPGCRMYHQPRVGGERPSWSWNGSMEAPTFRPSLLVRFPWGDEQKEVICHSFVTDGKIQFLGDCTHELKGQTVELPDWDDETWEQRQ